jgi:predicted nuclease of predicted toxin-antitoxin system
MCEPTRVLAVRAPVRLLVDEDLSPTVAARLRDEDGLDVVAVRDRGKLGATDREVLDLAFAEERILITANVADFERLASARELHAGIVLLERGDLKRDEQLAVVRTAVAAIEAELAAGRDMVNRVLLVGAEGKLTFESVPPATGAGT